MTTTEDARDPYGATESQTTEGRVFTVTGQDWDSIVSGIADEGDERVVVNMGPQHPSTHGVLRLILELDGETVTEAGREGVPVLTGDGEDRALGGVLRRGVGVGIVLCHQL